MPFKISWHLRMTVTCKFYFLEWSAIQHRAKRLDTLSWQEIGLRQTEIQGSGTVCGRVLFHGGCGQYSVLQLIEEHLVFL